MSAPVAMNRASWEAHTNDQPDKDRRSHAPTRIEDMTNGNGAEMEARFDSLIDVYQATQHGGTLSSRADARFALKNAFRDALSVCADGDHKFKNFHRLLCERFGYVHDEVDWKRDQLSLIEWIAKQVCADGGNGEAVALYQHGPIDSAGWYDGNADTHAYASALPDKYRVRILYTAPQAECAPRAKHDPCDPGNWRDGDDEMANYKAPRADADTAGAIKAIKALFLENPPDEIGPTEEPDSVHRLGYNSALEDAIDAIEKAAAGASNEHADAEKDVARLDFLIDKGAAVEAICGRYRVAKDYTLFCNWCDSPREAIDAAILAARDGKNVYSDGSRVPEKTIPPIFYNGDTKRDPELRELCNKQVIDGMSVAAPTPEHAQESAGVRLTAAQIEHGWRNTFSTSNPYCPVDLKSFTKAVRWAEYALIAANKEPQP